MRKHLTPISVVDCIGSGDAYISGVLYGLLAHPGEYQRALEYGNAISTSRTITVTCCAPTSRDQGGHQEHESPDI